MTEFQVSVTVAIISALLSGILGVVISIVYHRRYEKWRTKVDTLKAFVGYRYDVHGDSFSRSLNEIFLVFHDSTTVMELLSEYHKRVSSRSNSEEHLIRLFKAMCKDVGFDYKNFNDSFFLKPFNVKPTT